MKQLVETISRQDDPDPTTTNARSVLQKKGAEVVPALVLVFQENSGDDRRVVTIHFLSGVQGDISAFVPVIASELSTEPGEWKGNRWIGLAIKWLAKVEPRTGREIALKGLWAESTFIQSYAIEALGKIGESGDDKFVTQYATAHRAMKATFSEELAIKAETAALEIRKRATVKHP